MSPSPDELPETITTRLVHVQATVNREMADALTEAAAGDRTKLRAIPADATERLTEKVLAQVLSPAS